MRILKYLMTFTLLASIAGCYVEERGPRHPYHRYHDRTTIIVR